MLCITYACVFLKNKLSSGDHMYVHYCDMGGGESGILDKILDFSVPDKVAAVWWHRGILLFHVWLWLLAKVLEWAPVEIAT